MCGGNPMPELLFELGCEEIPAEDLEILSNELPRIATAQFEQNRLIHSNVRAEVGPRRLTLVADIEEMQREVREQKLGPPKKVAFDQNGIATQAGAGFAKNLKIPFREVKVVTTP